MKDNHDEVFDLFDDDGFDFEEDVVYTDEFDDEEELVEEEYDDEEYEEEFEEDFEEEYDDEEDIDEEDIDEEDIDDEDDELFTRKSTKKSGSRKGNGGGSKKGLLIALVAILAIVLIVLAVMFFGKGGNDEKETEGQTTTQEQTTTEEQTTAAPVTMAADTKAEVKPLMEQYYAAVKAADLAELGKVIDSTANISLQKMEKRAEYIEDFQNLTCYTLDGKDAGSYLVFVALDMKFVNIETVAPAMDYYYLKTREDGSLYVCTEWTQEEKDFISAQQAKEEVVNTIKAVNDRFDAALASDTKLNDFVKLLNGGGEVTTAAPDETTAAPTPEETTAAGETPAETTGAQETPAETTGAQTTGDTAVTTDKVRFRSSMDTSTSDNVIDELEAGVKVNVIEIKGDWCLVSLADNADKSGYIHMDFLDFN